MVWERSANDFVFVTGIWHFDQMLLKGADACGVAAA